MDGLIEWFAMQHDESVLPVDEARCAASVDVRRTSSGPVSTHLSSVLVVRL